MTRVTGRPLDTAGWKVSNLMYLWHHNTPTQRIGLYQSGLVWPWWLLCSLPLPTLQTPGLLSPPTAHQQHPHQSPVSPSHRPLILSPVMQPSLSTASATVGSMASRAASALLWTCTHEDSNQTWTNQVRQLQGQSSWSYMSLQQHLHLACSLVDVHSGVSNPLGCMCTLLLRRKLGCRPMQAIDCCLGYAQHLPQP